MGRCNLMCALLYAILDYTEKYGTDATSCTSKERGWNTGRAKRKNPQKIQNAKYNSYKPRPIDELYKFDPRPTDMRTPPDCERRNKFIVALQTASAASNSDGSNTVSNGTAVEI